MNLLQMCFILAYDLFTGGLSAVRLRLQLWDKPILRAVPARDEDIIHRLKRNNHAEQQFLFTSLSLLTNAVLWAAFIPMMIYGYQQQSMHQLTKHQIHRYEIPLSPNHPLPEHRVRLHPSPAPLSPCRKANTPSFYDKKRDVFPGGFITRY